MFGFGLGLWFFGFRRLCGLVGMLRLVLRLVFGAFELVLQFFVQAEGLLPAFELLARQLGFLFVCAEIE